MAAEPVPDLGWVSTGTPTPEPAPVPEPDGTALPDLVADDSPTASPPTPVPDPAQPAHPDGVTTVTVTAGDSLWSLSAAALGPGATDAEIAAAWPALYAANTVTIGADPDVIVAGQVLLSPPPAPAP
jgi:nucleoid-associated protein YgaU